MLHPLRGLCRLFPIIGLAPGLLLTPKGGAAQTDAFARPLTVLNDIHSAFANPPADTAARSLTLLNNISATFTTPAADVSARDLSLLNDISATFTNPAVDVSARDLTLLNDISGTLRLSPTDAFAREFTIGEGTTPLQDARTALSIAGGLQKLSSGDLTRLDLVGGSSSGKVDVLDAARWIRRAAGLDP